MNRKITPEESEQLFEFCKKHYVEYYDLQIELVDHLASAIEQQWKTDPKLPFNDALKNTFGKFGITGFSKIKEQKQKELQRKYNQLLWKFFIEFYKLPKIIMTFVFTAVLFTLFQLTEKPSWIVIAYIAFITISAIYYIFFFAPKNIKIKHIPSKKFMLIQHLNSIQVSVIFIAQLPLQSITWFNLLEKHNPNQWELFGLSFFIVAFTILLYGQFLVIPKKIKEHFIEHFAEFAV